MRCNIRANRSHRCLFISHRTPQSAFATRSRHIHSKYLGSRTWQRNLSLASIPAILVPPVVFGGLLITLWTYKCLMMIIFQNKIIYMPSVPPFSRSETVSEYANACRPVEWIEHSLKAADGTKIKLLEGSIGLKEVSSRPKHIVVLYFQGNASSLPPRLPHLSSILKSVQVDAANTEYTIVALSYRGFWTSSGSANQAGIELDAEAALSWVQEKFPSSKVVLWGQSIGAGIATTALSNMIRSEKGRELVSKVNGILLETPFTSLRAMLVALYPQKFLPYRYLTPFLQSTWDSEEAFQSIGEYLRSQKALGEEHKIKILMLQAENDEIVPTENSVEFEQMCKKWMSIGEGEQSSSIVERRIIRGALHTEVMVKAEGRSLIAKFLKSI